MTRKPGEVAQPFCLRLTPNERTLLQSSAEGLPLGEFIRRSALAGIGISTTARRARKSIDRRLLAQLLGQLGQLRLASNLNQLAKAANSGALPLSEETHTAILEACADIREIRITLMRALGKRI